MKALILVDLQNDFCTGGALEVPAANEIIPIANDLMNSFEHVIATQDWHPANHGSFAANHLWRKPGQIIDLDGVEQVLWPIHCVQESFGAEFVQELNTDLITKVFTKGMDINVDSYSGFFDNGHRNATGLGDYLNDLGIKEVYIMGLAADYCVKFTAIDAKKLGFDTYLIEDATRGVNINPSDTEKAFDEMKECGIHFISSNQIKK